MMRGSDKKVLLDPSAILPLSDVLSDFATADAAIEKHGSVILSDGGTWKYALMSMSEYEQYLRLKNDVAGNPEGEPDEKPDYKQLSSLLNGVGKRFLVENYVQFRKGIFSEEDLKRNPDESTATLRSRTSRARSIFRNNWQTDALKCIIDSPKTDAATSELAHLLLEKESKNAQWYKFQDDPEINKLKASNWQVIDLHQSFFTSADGLSKISQVLEKLDNKRFTFTCIELLKQKGLLDDETIQFLTDKDACKELFSCSGFPILSEVSLHGEITDEDICQNGRQRFYREKVTVGNRAFVLSNFWYGPGKSMPDNRTPFQEWVLERVEQSARKQSKDTKGLNFSENRKFTKTVE